MARFVFEDFILIETLVIFYLNIVSIPYYARGIKHRGRPSIGIVIEEQN